MTASGSGTGIPRREAALVVEQALGRVFDEGVVRQLREDSPLAVLGMTPADAVCVADAVSDAASASGWSCALGDPELSAAETVADLVDAVVSASTESTVASGEA